MKKAVSNFEAAFLFKIYLGPADLFGGRSPPAGGSGFSLQSFLLRRQANQKRIFTSPPNAIELIINYFANRLLFLLFSKKHKNLTFLLLKFQKLGGIIRIFEKS